MGSMALRKNATFPPVTLGHMRGHGCRELLVYCNSERCHHSAGMNADWLPMRRRYGRCASGWSAPNAGCLAPTYDRTGDRTSTSGTFELRTSAMIRLRTKKAGDLTAGSRHEQILRATMHLLPCYVFITRAVGLSAQFRLGVLARPRHEASREMLGALGHPDGWVGIRITNILVCAR
jgi:hypothetical protein